MVSDHLLLDPAIRNWVLFPIVFVTVLVGIARSNLSQLMRGDAKIDLDKLKHTSLIQRSQRLRQASSFIPPVAFAMRKHFFADADKGVLRQEIEVEQANPMQNPDQMMGMMKGNVAMMLPHMMMMGWLSFFFSGFVLVKIPFPLTMKFKPMLQRGIDLGTLDVSYVSSLSWYFIVMFGMRAFMEIVMGAGQADEAARMMQAQMGMGIGMGAGPQQFDANKAYQAEADSLDLLVHSSKVGDAEYRLLGKDVPR